jgi:diacylglycerol kinase
MSKMLQLKPTSTPKTRFYDYKSDSSSSQDSTSATRVKQGYSIFKSFRNAYFGLRDIVTTEPNLSFQFLIFVFSSFVMFFRLDLWILANFCFFVVVFCFEIMNSAIERICDFVQPNFDPIIGRIKDISAASVLLASLAWGTVILTKFILILVTLRF